MQIRALFRLTWDLAWQTELAIIIILEVSFHWSLAMGTTSIALLDHRNGLTNYFSLNNYGSFNEILPVIEILIFFIKVRLYQWPEIIQEITNKQFIQSFLHAPNNLQDLQKVLLNIFWKIVINRTKGWLIWVWSGVGDRFNLFFKLRAKNLSLKGEQVRALFLRDRLHPQGAGILSVKSMTI